MGSPVNVTTCDSSALGGSLKIKMADGGIQRNSFIVKHDGSIDFFINRKTAVQELRFFHARILTPQNPNLENSPLQAWDIKHP